MKPQSTMIVPSTLALLLSFQLIAAAADTHESFLQCLSLHSENSTSISKVIYTQYNSSYSSVLELTLQNLRFSTPATPKPLVIITPIHVSHIQAAIKCSQKYGMQIRVRSGGHDYEGLSFRTSYNSPFVIIDMINLSSISIDVENKTAWVQVGATLGQLYYRIAEKSPNLAFPAGSCPSVGTGGHISGGGWGILLRKYGLAADNIVDAHMIDVQGRFLDRKSMGEDLFWAIRGGGGASFGVIVAWKIKLVDVPSTVTVFTVRRPWDQIATKLVHRWQHVAHKLPEDLFIMVFLRSLSSGTEGNRTMEAIFQSLFLGGVEKLLPLMQERFPELGLVKEDCNETSWIQSIMIFNGFESGESLDILLQRTNYSDRRAFKAKSDYVREPMPGIALEGIYERLSKVEAEAAQLFFVPYGGKMSEISKSAIPFPHRAGNIYEIGHLVLWAEDGIDASQRHINWIRELYSYMTPYVSKNPRAAYINYRDLDIGTNNEGYTSYKEASVWGKKYFNHNFDRLVHVKTSVDPDNFFRNEQSIPPLSSWKKKRNA
ncbi:Berberine bridge enzyme-like 18 [Citrus sinensis]|uniref:Berberine bridge enzyme-like 18 n=1 Tax=Citrus sinensis TaxID=2711 RepID=A0ACB8NEF8_CITSI|nr:Berberine bridge enzyme-like 18 [Citrus sinensis]